jgi:hypothetical protein
MTIVIVLLALSTATGLALGASFNWYSIAISSPPLALFAAIVLQRAGFGSLLGIATVAACLSVDQIAFVVMGVTLAHPRSEGKASRRVGA